MKKRKSTQENTEHQQKQGGCCTPKAEEQPIVNQLTNCCGQAPEPVQEEKKSNQCC